MTLNRNNFLLQKFPEKKKKYIFGMSVENHIIKVSFCGTFQKAVKPKRSYYCRINNLVAASFSCTYINLVISFLVFGVPNNFSVSCN